METKNTSLKNELAIMNFQGKTAKVSLRRSGDALTAARYSGELY